MHTAFGEWHRLAGIEPNGDTLRLRWAGIEAYTPSRGDVAALARLFYRLGKPDQTFLSAFIEKFQGADPAFKTRDNDNELSVLAGATLVNILDQPNSLYGNIAALTLVCGAAGNLRPPPSVREIPELATRYLTKQSTRRMSLHDGADTSEDRKEFLRALAALGPPHDKVATELQVLRQQLLVVGEESNMLWWLFAEHSRDEEKRWNTFSVPATALMAAKELADLTTVLPGPIAAFAFLDRVIRCAKSPRASSIAVKTAINDLSLHWRQLFMEDGYPNELEDVLPISHGIKLSVGAPESDAWLPAFTLGTNIPSDAMIGPSILAFQLYREALLCRAWKAAN